MLGYRHAFHAGNHADIVKHCVLLECLSYMIRKDKPILFLDTHAGAGAYAFQEGYAALNEEWRTGYGRLSECPEAVSPEGILSRYRKFASGYIRDSPGEFPGSPAIAARVLRNRDSLVFCELHPADGEELARRFQGDRRVRVRKENGFSLLKAVLPPPTRRGLIFIDPSYELPQDYDALGDSLADALARFATGTYIVWYPLLERPESMALPARLSSLSDRPCIRLSLRVRGIEPGERGMSGSGMVVINPPWTLEASLRIALPSLVQALGQDDRAGWELDARN